MTIFERIANIPEIFGILISAGTIGLISWIIYKVVHG